MKNIVLIPNKSKDKALYVTAKVIETLAYYSATLYIDESYQCDIKGIGCTFYKEFPADAELIIVIGGDGSMLDASVYAIKNNIPMLGVNLGKVGYLTEIEPDSLDSLKNIFDNHYNIHEKMLLSVTYSGRCGDFCAPRLAVNDVVISHENYLGIADFTLEAHDGAIRYRADGLSISTPAGSTAYSLSAGGPIVSHNVNSVVVTPICPHSFFNRSIVFSDDELLKISNTGKENLNISVDGRHFNLLSPGDECKISVSEKKLKVMSFKQNNMFSTLFKKIRILEDI